MLRTIALAAVLLAGPAVAQETRSESKPSQAQSGEEAKADQKAGDEKAQGAKGADTQAASEKPKGYGYGTPSGTEAQTEAKQAAGEPKKKTPQQEKGASVTQPHARAETGILTGRIVSTDEDRLTIEAPDGMRDIQITGRTEVRGEGRTSTSQLQRGDEVRVSFDPKEGVSVAKRIEVRSTGSSGKADLTMPPPGSSTPPGSTMTPSGTPSGPAPGMDTPGGTTAPGGTRK